MSYHLIIRSPDVKRYLTNHSLFITFCRRSPGLPLLVNKIAFCRAFREIRCHDITRLNILKDAPNCSLYTVSDRLLNEHEALVEWQRLEETEVPGEKLVSVSLYIPQKLQIDNYVTLSITIKSIQNKRWSVNKRDFRKVKNVFSYNLRSCFIVPDQSCDVFSRV